MKGCPAKTNRTAIKIYGDKHHPYKIADTMISDFQTMKNSQPQDLGVVENNV